MSVVTRKLQKKAKVTIDEEREQENEQVELPFDSTSQTDPNCVCTISSKTFLAFTKNIWIGDIRASCHITNNDDGMFHVKT